MSTFLERMSDDGWEVIEEPQAKMSLPLETFANPCHNPHDGRFCETHGGPEEYRSGPEQQAEQAQIAKEIAAQRAREGRKPLSEASMKVYVSKEYSRRKSLQKIEQATKKPGEGSGRKQVAPPMVIKPKAEALGGRKVKTGVPPTVEMQPLTPNRKAGAIRGLNAMQEIGIDFSEVAPFSVSKDTKRTRYGAYYQPLYTTTGKGLVKLSANVDRAGEGYAAFTFTHEVGHHLDFTSRRGKLGHSNAAEFLDLVRDTKYRIERRRDITRGRKSYLNSNKELFARAFSQWVTQRSSDQRMKNVLDARRADHWDEEDFAPIAAYFDRLHKEGNLT